MSDSRFYPQLQGCMRQGCSNLLQLTLNNEAALVTYKVIIVTDNN